MPDPVVVSASAKHTASFIFLHGLGDTGTLYSGSIYLGRAHSILHLPSWPRRHRYTTLVVSLSVELTASFIFLHGLGETAIIF